MSRFDKKHYKRLLESPGPERYRNTQDLYKEKTLWKLEGLRKYFACNMLKVQCIIILSSLILGLFLILWLGKNTFSLIIACVVGFGPLLFMTAWFIGDTTRIKA